MATAPPHTLHDAEFAQLAMALVLKNQQLTDSSKYEFKGVVFTTDRKHQMSDDPGIPQLVAWGERYPVVWLSGVRLFSGENWLVTGPWCKQLPELAAQQLDALQVRLDSKQAAKEAKRVLFDRAHQERARRQQEKVLALWNQNFGGGPNDS